jgi:hypothetical protein
MASLYNSYNDYLVAAPDLLNGFSSVVVRKGYDCSMRTLFEVEKLMFPSRFACLSFFFFSMMKIRFEFGYFIFMFSLVVSPQV